MTSYIQRIFVAGKLRRAISFFGFCLVFCLSSCSSGLLTPTPDSGPLNNFTRLTVVVAGDQDYPPYSYLDENQQPTGFDNDLITAVAAEQGFDIDIQLMPWSEARTALENGTVDMIAGMAYSVERDELYDFSIPTTMVSFNLFVSRDSDINSLEDAQDHVIIVQDGGAMHDYLLTTGLTSLIIPVQDARDALLLLEQGQGDAVLMNRIQGNYLISEQGFQNIRSVNINLDPIQYSFAVREGNSTLLYRLNEGLNAINISGEYSLIYNRYFGVYDRNQFWDSTKYFVIPLIVLLISLALFFIWNKSLRKQVAQRTQILRKNEANIRQIVDNAVEGILVWCEDRYVFTNIPAIKLTGYSMAELEKLQLGQLFVTKDARQLEEQLLLEPNKPKGINEDLYQILTRNGKTRWVRCNSIPIDWEGHSAVLLFLSDVTDQKNAEDAVRASEERYRLIFQRSPAGIVFFNTDLIITDMNERYLEILQASREFLMNYDLKTLRDKRGIHAFHDALDGHEGVYEGPFESSLFCINIDILLRTAPIFDEKGVVKGGVGIVLDMGESKRIEEQIKRQLRFLSSLRSVDMAIMSSTDLEYVLRILMQQVIAQLNADAVSIHLYDDQDKVLKFAIGEGLQSTASKRSKYSVGQGPAGWVAFERKILVLPDQSSPVDFFIQSEDLTRENAMVYIGLPLISKDEIKGVMQVIHRTPMDITPDWLNFLESLAGQAAIAIENATLLKNLQSANAELVFAYDATIEGWAHALELRDGETEGHSQRVTDMTMILAKAKNISEEEMIHIRRGALLHDIGKMAIPDSVLMKNAPLTEEEWVIMRRHPDYAYQLLSAVKFLKPALDIPYYHHEHWDGTGYPQGLSGEKIPLIARIFAVVDAWDALNSDRPYRKAWPQEQAHSYLTRQAGKRYDPEVVKLFFEVFKL